MTRQLFFLAMVAAATTLVLGGTAQRASAQITVNPGPVPALPTDVYAAKFLCGTHTPPVPGVVEGPVKPGNYQTAINVHNPNRSTVSFRKKAILLYRADAPPAPEQPQPPGPFVQAALKANWGLEIDCNDIRSVLLDPAVAPPDPIFMKGWVVLEVVGGSASQGGPKPLDVVAAYTAHGFSIDPFGLPSNSGFSLDIVPVEAKRQR